METSSATPRLFVGTASDVRVAIKKYVEQIVPCKGCGVCRLCDALVTGGQESPYCYSAPPCALWLIPKPHGYVREQLDEALEALTVELDVHEASVFIIEAADQLNSATANRLLKIIEEPPAHWHIMLSTDRLGDVLPTLRSRCIEIALHSSSDDSGQALDQSIPFTWLQNPRRETWFEAVLKFDELPKTVPATRAALDRLIIHWHKLTEIEPNRAWSILAILIEMAEIPPQPGGCMGFWRVLFSMIYRKLSK